MTLVITGASGFIGSALSAALGARALGLTRRANVYGLLTVSDYAAAPAPSGAVLVHLAEPSNVGAAEAAGDAHAAATLDLCERLLSRPWAHVVYASSAIVYGDDLPTPRRPDEAVAPSGVYARAKLACEAAVLAAGGTVLRFSNVYGLGMAPTTVQSDILAGLGLPGPLVLRDTETVRDFLHVDDAVAAIAAAAELRPGGVLNVGTGIGTSAGALAKQMLGLVGESGRPVTAACANARPSHLVLDISDTHKRVGWVPHISLATGLRMLLKVKA